MANLDLFASAHALDGLTQKQQQILDAAIDVFAEKGYAGASTHEIAARAGVAEGNIFARFHNKRGLLNAVIQPIIDRIFPYAVADLVDHQLRHEYQTREAFCRELITGRLHLLHDNGALVKVFVTELFNQQEIRDMIIAHITQDYWRQLNQVIDGLKARGELVAQDNHSIMRVLWSIVGGTAVAYLYFGQPLNDEVIGATVAAAVKALAPE